MPAPSSTTSASLRTGAESGSATPTVIDDPLLPVGARLVRHPPELVMTPIGPETRDKGSKKPSGDSIFLAPILAATPIWNAVPKPRAPIFKRMSGRSNFFTDERTS